MPFQQTVYTRQAPAVAGMFASDNPREFYPGGPNGLVAGSSGVTIGNFAWVQSTYLDWDSGPSIVNNFGFGAPIGIVHRNQVGLITTFLSEAGMGIPQGCNVSVMANGDIWLKNAGSNQCVPGMKAYATLSSGAVTFNYSGTPTVAASQNSGASITAGSGAVTTGTIVGNVLTTGASVTNTIYPGAIVTGSNVTTGTYIVAQLTGSTTGGAGTYAVNVPEQSVSSTTLTITPMVYNPGTMQAGTVSIGSVIVASGVSGGSTYTTSNATTGVIAGMSVMAAVSASTWSLAPAPTYAAAGTLTSGTVVTETNIETKWYAISAGAAGELVRCASIRTS